MQTSPGLAVQHLVLWMLALSIKSGPAEAADPTCLATTVVGGRSYGVAGTPDALLQLPNITRLCSGGGVAHIAAVHASVPNIYYNGVAKSSNTRGVVSGLRVYCADGVVMYEDDLPHSSAYLATKAIDEAQLANIAPFGSAAELALAISSYSISKPTALWLGSEDLEAVLCPANSVIVGVTTAAFYGGVDYVALICAPSCFDASLGAAIQVNGADVIVGTASGAPAALAPPLASQTCRDDSGPVHVGPGFSYVWGSQFANKNFPPQQGIVTKTCKGGAFITQWDIRAFNYTESYTGLRIASLGARCSDGSLLDAVPSGGLVGPQADVYFTSTGQSGINDASGWNIIPYGRDNAIQFGFAQFMEVGAKAQDFPPDCETFCPEQPTFVQCPSEHRAIGYTAAGFDGGGVDVIDVICGPACGIFQRTSLLSSAAYPPPFQPPPASGPVPASPSINETAGGDYDDQPDAIDGGPAPPMVQQHYGCGSTVRAHIGPGAYAGWNTSRIARQGALVQSSCPAGGFINSWHIGIIENDTTSEDGPSISSIRASCAKDRAGSFGGPVLAGAAADTADGNETIVISDDRSGFTDFDVTSTREGALRQLLGINEQSNPPDILSCPGAFIAIGFTSAADKSGINYLGIICGPALPPDCPDSSFNSTPSNSNAAQDSVPTPVVHEAPFVYTSRPAGPSWTSSAQTPASPAPPVAVRKPAPPPPNAPGNSIVLGNLSPDKKVLEVVLSVSGTNVFPFTKALQVGFAKALALVLKTLLSNVIYVRAVLRLSSTNGRHLLLQQAISNLSSQTVFVTYDIQAGSPAQVFADAEALADAFVTGSFQAALRQSGTTGVDAALEATTAASATQASSTTTCQRTFGHWCLDGSRLSRGGLAGIITAGCLVLLALTGAIVFLALRRARNTGSLPGHSEPPH